MSVSLRKPSTIERVINGVTFIRDHNRGPAFLPRWTLTTPTHEFILIQQEDGTYRGHINVIDRDRLPRRVHTTATYHVAPDVIQAMRSFGYDLDA